MKVPKEIYMLKTKTPDGDIRISYHSYPFETEKTTSVKYIRADKVVDKDALMETLREKRAEITECSATNDRKVAAKVAALSVIDFLISKINEL